MTLISEEGGVEAGLVKTICVQYKGPQHSESEPAPEMEIRETWIASALSPRGCEKQSLVSSV